MVDRTYSALAYLMIGGEVASEIVPVNITMSRDGEQVKAYIDRDLCLMATKTGIADVRYEITGLENVYIMTECYGWAMIAGETSAVITANTKF